MAEASDRDLVLRTRRGEVGAFGELVRKYQTSVFNVCYRMVGERREAEDQTQEAFLRAYQRLGSFDVDRPFGPWMRRVAANLCLNWLALRQPAFLPWEEEWVAGTEPSADPESVRRERELESVLRAALKALTPRQRAVVELRHFQDMSYAEIAATLAVSLSDVKSDLFRARRTLARRLQDAE
jgi:RNA polymerase sigma-70 factor (ECF subfamily)